MKSPIATLSSIVVAGMVSSALCLSPIALAGDNVAQVEKKELKNKLKTEQVKTDAIKADVIKDPNHDLKAKLKKAKHKAKHKIRVNINTASAVELRALKGIGKKKAKAIVSYRKKNGKFKSIDDLVNVKGIGKKLVKKNHQRIILTGKSILPSADKMKKKKRKLKVKLKEAAEK